MIADLPDYPGLAQLNDDELRGLMPTRTGSNPDAQVEQWLRRVFLYAIQTCSSDVHMLGIGTHSETSVRFGIRGTSGLENFVYVGDNGRHFMDKMFALTNTPQGGSTAPIISTRFSIELPYAFAASLGLKPEGKNTYAIDIRVEFIRTVDGWKFTSRLLDQQRIPRFDEMPLTGALKSAIRRAITKPSGLVLVSGPTGSGKSTTLKAILDLLNDGTRAIATIENPVEYRLRGDGPLAQIQVTNEVTFAKALRSVLRQDPDTILVGEIRDEETMEIAMAAAQTGHLVLSTIHANSAPETITRALELAGSKSMRHAYVLSEVLRLVVAQRLVTKYSGRERRRDLQTDEAAWLASNGMGHMKLVTEVEGESRMGKVPLMEGIEITPEIKALIRSPDLSSEGIYRLARNQVQYETLAMAGVRAVESQGVKLRDCMVGLETTAEAMVYPGLRLEAARAQGVSLSAVSMAIDRQSEAHERGEAASLDACLREVAESTWEAA